MDDDSRTVTPGTTRPVGSVTVPEGVAGACDAPAIGSATHHSAVTIAARDAADNGRRWAGGFSMVRILLSSVDGRAIDGAGSHVRPCARNARARSTRCAAYAVRPMPCA